MQLGEYCLLAVGVTYFLSVSAIFYPVRKLIADRHGFFEQLIYCPMCTGFWVGMALSPLYAFVDQPILNTFCGGFVSMGAMFITMQTSGGGNPAYAAERQKPSE